MPKSRSFSSPCQEMSALSGETSQWMIRSGLPCPSVFLWAYSSPCRSWSTTKMACSGVMAVPERAKETIMSFSDTPFTSSIEMK